MKTNYSYRYLTLAALVGLWSCSSSRQTAQNVGEMDDLYGNSANAAVYASASSDGPSVAQRPSRQQQRMERQQRSSRSDNPEYFDDQQGYSNANTDEYYAELSARKLNRGLSPDPGWNDNGTNAYNSGFVNGFNAANTSALSWNRWGFNNMGFYNGLGLGLGMGAFGGFGGFNRFGGGFYDPFFSPFYGNSFAYGGGFYDPFYSPFYGGGFGGFNNFGMGFGNPFFSPFYGGGFGRPVIVNNVLVTGADPYRNRTYGPRYDRSSSRYNDAFVNTPRSSNDPNAGGRRASGSTYYSPRDNSGNASSANATSGSNNGYYSSPRQNSRGTYYYDNSAGSNGRQGAATSAPAYNSGNTSNSEYYARPRQNSRGSTYTPAEGSRSSGARGSYSQPSYSQPSYQQPSYQSQSQSRGSYSQPSQSTYSAPAPSAPSSGGSGYSSGGGSRGPR